MGKAALLGTALMLTTALAASREVVLTVPGAELHATLQTPADVIRPPIALILAGSGPTDRDGNNPFGVSVGSYRKLADALEAAGIATLRPDKRLIGASRASDPSEAALRFDDYVNDARAWLNWMAAQPTDGPGGGSAFGPLILIGHSEGSLIGLAALQAAPVPVAAFVSLAGPGENLAVTVRRQLHANPDTFTAALLQEGDQILDALLNGQTVAQVSPPLAGLFRPSVQPYWISELKFDPVVLIRQLTVPVLIVQGGRDLQVGVADAQKLAGAQPAATLVIVTGMNHVLVNAPAEPEGNMATYAQPDLPLSPGLLTPLIRFLRSLHP